MSRRVMVLWVPEDVVLTLLGNWRQVSYVCLPYLEECADYLGNRFALPKDIRTGRREISCVPGAESATTVQRSHPVAKRPIQDPQGE